LRRRQAADCGGNTLRIGGIALARLTGNIHHLAGGIDRRKQAVEHAFAGRDQQHVQLSLDAGIDGTRQNGERRCRRLKPGGLGRRDNRLLNGHTHSGHGTNGKQHDMLLCLARRRWKREAGSIEVRSCGLWIS
jgi:hypothetical protein